MQLAQQAVTYPSSDGRRMAESMTQGRWIVYFYGNLCALFRAAPDVLVAADNLWYPVEGHNKLCQAPDVYVVFGRPKGDRKSYKQWEEGGVPLTVVFEVYSPGNDWREMADKLAFYDEHGVEEYYVYNPDTDDLLVYVRGRAALRLVHFTGAFTSPRLGIRFDLTGDEMRVLYPDGKPFLSFEDLKDLQERETARADAQAARADNAEAAAVAAQARMARMAELSRKVRRGLATPEEALELDSLEGPG